MASTCVFVSAPLPGDALVELAARAKVVLGTSGLGLADPLFAAAPESFDGLVLMLNDRVDEALLARAARVRVVANVAVGVDNIDFAACAARGVTVTHTPGVLTEATADLAFALLLAAARRVCEGDRLVRQGQFPSWTPTFLLGARVHGAAMGIVGFGRIGQAMARRARGFGMRVSYAQRRAVAPEMERAMGAEHVSVEELFAKNDFVSLHCPLTPETHHLVNGERLAAMKRGAVLVNTARGACVDESALVSALENGPLGAAGLDVFENEPRVNPALATLSNVVLTPHIGSADREAREGMARMAVESVIAVLEGRKPANRAVR